MIGLTGPELSYVVYAVTSLQRMSLFMGNNVERYFLKTLTWGAVLPNVHEESD